MCAWEAYLFKSILPAEQALQTRAPVLVRTHAQSVSPPRPPVPATFAQLPQTHGHERLLFRLAQEAGVEHKVIRPGECCCGRRVEGADEGGGGVEREAGGRGEAAEKGGEDAHRR